MDSTGWFSTLVALGWCPKSELRDPAGAWPKSDWAPAAQHQIYKSHLRNGQSWKLKGQKGKEPLRNTWGEAFGSCKGQVLASTESDLAFSWGVWLIGFDHVWSCLTRETRVKGHSERISTDRFAHPSRQGMVFVAMASAMGAAGGCTTLCCAFFTLLHASSHVLPGNSCVPRCVQVVRWTQTS